MAHTGRALSLTLGSVLLVLARGLLDSAAVENQESETRPPVNVFRMLNASALAALENQAAGLSNVSLWDLQMDNGTQQLQQSYRARKKQERLISIQADILQRLRVNPWRYINHNASTHFSQVDRHRMQQIFERMHQMRGNNGNLHIDQIAGSSTDKTVFAERFQSFYPSCVKPNHTDRVLWEAPGTLHVYYPISFPSRDVNSSTETTILSAKLRLHKRSGPVLQEESNCVDCPPPPDSYPSFLLPPQPSITVSVFHFVKPLKPHRRERKRLVASQVVAANFEGWMDFNVEPSIQQWFHSRHRNYGLDIEVDDASGNKLDPNRYFRSVNCSDPNDMAENESSVFDNETYPTLDLQTAEFSRHPLPQQRQQDSQQDNGHQMTSGDHQRFFRKRHTGYVYLTQAWNQLCKRETLYVSFQDLGLDSLIVEPGIRVSYCTSVHRRQTHDYSEERNHQKDEDCCVPRSYRPVHLHYLGDDGDTHRFTMNHLSARHCHCPNS